MADHQNRGPGMTDADFVASASEVFARNLFQPMFERASHAPEDVRHLIYEIRHKLDALETVVDTMLPHGTKSANASADATKDIRPSRVGTTLSAKPTIDAHASDPFDDIGRNQRSRLRELTLLEFLARDTRAYSLQQVLGALHDKGFDDTSGAVVSQLHRLKKLGVVNQPAVGMYEITSPGLTHLHQTRASFGSLLETAQV